MRSQDPWLWVEYFGYGLAAVFIAWVGGRVFGLF
jgi:hypothetical protein